MAATSFGDTRQGSARPWRPPSTPLFPPSSSPPLRSTNQHPPVPAPSRPLPAGVREKGGPGPSYLVRRQAARPGSARAAPSVLMSAPSQVPPGAPHEPESLHRLRYRPRRGRSGGEGHSPGGRHPRQHRRPAPGRAARPLHPVHGGGPDPGHPAGGGGCGPGGPHLRGDGPGSGGGQVPTRGARDRAAQPAHDPARSRQARHHRRGGRAVAHLHHQHRDLRDDRPGGGLPHGADGGPEPLRHPPHEPHGGAAPRHGGVGDRDPLPERGRLQQAQARPALRPARQPDGRGHPDRDPAPGRHTPGGAGRRPETRHARLPGPDRRLSRRPAPGGGRQRGPGRAGGDRHRGADPDPEAHGLQGRPGLPRLHLHGGRAQGQARHRPLLRRPPGRERRRHDPHRRAGVRGPGRTGAGCPDRPPGGPGGGGPQRGDGPRRRPRRPRDPAPRAAPALRHEAAARLPQPAHPEPRGPDRAPRELRPTGTRAGGAPQ